MNEHLKPVETWRDEKRTPAWLFAAARAMHQWPTGREVSESTYTQAIEATKNIKIGG